MPKTQPDIPLRKLAAILRDLPEARRDELFRLAWGPENRPPDPEHYRQIRDRILRSDRETLRRIGSD